MNAISVHVPSLSLDLGIRSTLVQEIVDTLPHIPNFSDAERAAQRDAAFALLAMLDPRDPPHAMYTIDAIAAHSASVHAWRCAARADLPLAAPWVLFFCLGAASGNFVPSDRPTTFFSADWCDLATPVTN